MRAKFLYLAITLIGVSCRNTAVISLRHNNPKKFIAIQPLDNYDDRQISILENQLSHFFHIAVICLSAKAIEPTLPTDIGKGYLADSLLPILLKETNDTIVQVVGITHNEVYILKPSTFRLNSTDTTMYFYSRLFGYAFQSKKACVVSDYRLKSTDTALWMNRIKNVAIHEIGHSLGLSHCSVADCLMSEKYSDIANLNKTGRNYCSLCRKKLN